MEAKTEMAASRRRSFNFSTVQTLFLVNEVIKRRKFISGRRNAAGVTNIARSRHWTEITQEFNSQYPDSQRTVGEIRKKWDNFSNKAKKDIRIMHYQLGRVQNGENVKVRQLDEAALLYMRHFMDEENGDSSLLDQNQINDSDTGFDIKEQADSECSESSVHLEPIDYDLFNTSDLVDKATFDSNEETAYRNNFPPENLCQNSTEYAEVIEMMKDNELKRRQLLDLQLEKAEKERVIVALKLFRAQNQVRQLLAADVSIELPEELKKWV